MKWEELRKEALDLSASDRLFLVEAIVRSLGNELRPRRSAPEGTWERLRGSLKTDGPTPTDAEVKAMLEESLEEKYLRSPFCWIPILLLTFY